MAHLIDDAVKFFSAWDGVAFLALLLLYVVFSGVRVAALRWKAWRRTRFDPKPESLETSDPRVKYVVHPGHVVSCNDGQCHFVSASALVDLYSLRPGEYVVFDKDKASRTEVSYPNAVHLYPRYDGDYRLPKAVSPRGDVE